MPSRPAQLVAMLDLEPHPEGGHYRRGFRSDRRVQPADSRSGRAALSSIYYLLRAGETGRWHRVASDEVWHYCEGDPLELLVLDAGMENLSRYLLGPLDGDAEPVRVIPAGSWQATRSTGTYTLAGCTVGPGFEYEDFQLLSDCPDKAELLRARHPGLAAYL